MKNAKGWFVAVGVGVGVYLIWKYGDKLIAGLAGAIGSIGRAADNLMTGVRSGAIVRTDDPIMESATGVLTASILIPVNNGTGRREAFGRNLQVKFAINNPDAERVLDVEIRVEYFGRILKDKEIESVRSTIRVPKGRSTWTGNPPTPSVGFNDGVAQILIGGQASSFPSTFYVE